MSDDEEFSGPPPGFYDNRRRVSVCAEPFNPNAVDDSPKVVHPKTDEQRLRLRGSFHHIFLFRSLDTEQTQEVMDAMFEKKVQKGEYIIVQGDDGDNFYVIDEGVYDIFVSVGGGDPKNVGKYDNKGSFGELALMYNTPRAATIQAATDGVLWALDRTTFRRILLTAAFKKRKLYEEFLEAVPMLSSLERYEKMTLADALQAKKFEDGDCIIKQGDAADNFYFVEKGMVKVMVKQTDDSDEVFVSNVEKGGYFGELALVTHKPRAASVYAVGPVTCAFLDVGAFERLLGPCMDIMKRNFSNYEEQLVNLFGSSMNITDARK